MGWGGAEERVWSARARVDDREGADALERGGGAVRELGAADVALRERVVLRDAHERPHARGGRRRHPEAATREVW